MSTSFLPEPGSTAAMTAAELRAQIAARRMTAREVAEALLDRIAQVEPHIHAFAWHDPAGVLAQADALDAWQRAGRTLGPLHGVPVGLKDIIDVAGMPTAFGTSAVNARLPQVPSAIAEKLNAAGAIIMGKTVTTELAFMHPGPTRNPLDTGHTPGGSSSGSAAAVAAGMVPLAVGTQTGGSVIRPASYCGIIGYKPSFGRISRRGVQTQSPSLDTIGVFSRDIRDAALLVDTLSDTDRSDTALDPAVQPVLSLALVRLPGVAEDHYTRLRDSLSTLPKDQVQIAEVALPDLFSKVAGLRELINFVEMAHHYEWVMQDGRSGVSDTLREAIAKGQSAKAVHYAAALTEMSRARRRLADAFDGYDAILSTATAGLAPEGLESTGTAICNGIWTFTGAPSITLPMAATSRSRLRHGLQITCLEGHDAHALKVAQRLFRLMPNSAL